MRALGRSSATEEFEFVVGPAVDEVKFTILVVECPARVSKSGGNPYSSTGRMPLRES